MERPMPSPEALRNVRRLSSYFCNADDPGEERAAAALETGAPAYWATFKAPGLLPLWRDYANTFGGIANGLAEYRREFATSGRDSDKRLVTIFLDKLVPLNKAAIHDLNAAYRALLATWRDG